MGDRQIPQKLIEKYGEEILSEGSAATDRRRAEFVFNHPGELQPEFAPITSQLWPATIKLWPVIILAAITNKHGGAARIWALSKAIDSQGAGKVSRADLWAFCAGLGIGERKRLRWLCAALELGLFREVIYRNGEVVYRLASWGRGAGMLGCSQIGKPANVTAKALVSPGWRAHVWAGYLATLEGQIISQETKYKITGVDPRTQRNYQATLAVKRIQNYSNTNLSDPGDIPEKHLFINPKTNKVVQRIPDIIIVPSDVARSVPKGRSRKAQREIHSRMLGGNSSYSAAGPSDSMVRLFHETKKGAEKALRRLDQFGEAFWCKKTWENANQWGILVQL